MNTIISPFADTVLAHHAYQGQTNDCGPFCAAMVVNAVAPHAVTAEAMARESARLGSRGRLPVVRRVPGWVTFPWGVVDILREHGLQASWRAVSSEDQLRAILSAGRLPVVVLGSWRPLWGHWVVVLAHNPDLGWGLADPGSPSADLVWIPEARFRDWWRALGRIVVEIDPAPAIQGDVART